MKSDTEYSLNFQTHASVSSSIVVRVSPWAITTKMAGPQQCFDIQQDSHKRC